MASESGVYVLGMVSESGVYVLGVVSGLGVYVQGMVSGSGVYVLGVASESGVYVLGQTKLALSCDFDSFISGILSCHFFGQEINIRYSAGQIETVW